MLRGEEKFAGERVFRRAIAQGCFGRYSGSIRVIVFLGQVRQNEIASAGVKAFWVSEIITNGTVGEMAGVTHDALLDEPWIRPRFEHVWFVIRFQDQAVRTAQSLPNEMRNTAQVSYLR